MEIEQKIEKEPSKKRRVFKKILGGLGTGGFLVGGGIISTLYYILSFIFTAIVGLSAIGMAITLFLEGSIIWGLITLLILTPLAIALAHYLFLYCVILTILSAIIWGIATIFGFDISFGTAGEIVWLLGKIAILGVWAFLGVILFRESVKEKNILGFFKDYWLGILLFCFLFWLFFL